ncbi:collagen binding domain-containing protein [Planctomycetota bacterium]
MKRPIIFNLILVLACILGGVLLFVFSPLNPVRFPDSENPGSYPQGENKEDPGSAAPYNPDPGVSYPDSGVALPPLVHDPGTPPSIDPRQQRPEVRNPESQTNEQLVENNDYVRGIVIDSDNRLLPGILVKAFDYSSMALLKSVHTGKKGEFRFYTGPSRVVALKAEQDGYAVAMVNKALSGGKEYILRLADPAVIVGRVVAGSTKRPVRKYTLLACRQNGRLSDVDKARFNGLPSGWRQEKTVEIDDPRGNFIVTDLSPGYYALFVYPVNYGFQCYLHEGDNHLLELQRDNVGIYLNSGSMVDGIEIQVQPTEPASGVVRDVSGKPLKDIKISPWFGQAHGGAVGMPIPEKLYTFTDTDGYFEINFCNPYRTGSLKFEKAGYVTRTANFYYFYARQGSDDIQVKNPAPVIVMERFEKGGSIYGYIAAPDGARHQGETVVLQGRLKVRHTRTDSNGDYFFDGLPAGKFVLYVDGNFGVNFGSSEDITLRQGQVLERNFTPGTGKAVWGLVMLGEEALSGVVVELRGQSQDGSIYSKTTNTDENGDYRINNVEPGEYRIVIRPRGMRRPLTNQFVVVEVDNGANKVEKNIYLPATRVSGRLLDADTEKPVTNARILLQLKNASGKEMHSFEGRSDKNGDFSIVALTAGEYSIRIWSRKYQPQLLAQTVSVAKDEHIALNDIHLSLK